MFLSNIRQKWDDYQWMWYGDHYMDPELYPLPKFPKVRCFIDFVVDVVLRPALCAVFGHRFVDHDPTNLYNDAIVCKRCGKYHGGFYDMYGGNF